MSIEAPVKELVSQEHPLHGRPDPDYVRGSCPMCGDEVVSNCYYVGGKGYIMIWECWSSLGEVATCDYRRVL